MTIHKKEFNEIIGLFKSIYPSPYELIYNIIKVINSYNFFKESELSRYVDLDINCYPIISKIKIDSYTIQAIELITSTLYKDCYYLIIMFRFYLEEHLYVHLDEQCPKCSYQFGLTILRYNEIIGVGCHDCGYFRDSNGNLMNMTGKEFYPLKNIELEKFLNYIYRPQISS